MAELTEQDLDEIFPVMALLEGRCAFDAVRKAKPHDLKRLDDIHARLEKYAAAGDIERYYEQNYTFHEAVQKLAGNLWLQKTVGDLRKFLKLLSWPSGADPGQEPAHHPGHGWFLTTAIFLSHGSLQIPGGTLADKLGAKQVAFWALVIITIGNILIGFSDTYTAILTLKFVVGIGTGMALIAGARYVPTFFSGKEIQRAQGVYSGSILLGSGFVLYGVPQLLALVGWHNVFIVTGGMAGLPFAVIFNGARTIVQPPPEWPWALSTPGGPIGVKILPPIIGWLVDLSGTFVSGLFALAVAALLGCLCSLALKPPRQVC